MKFFGKKTPYLLILVLVTIPLVFAQINEEFVIFTDELIIEEVAYQMAESNNLLQPTFQNRVWLEKPPLYYWLTSLFYKVFPVLPFVRRLWTAIFSVLLILITFLLGNLIFAPTTSLLAGLIMLTNYYFLALSKAGNLDLPASFFVTLTFYFYLRGKKKNLYFIFSGIVFGLAFLTRSFLALTPLLVIFLDTIFEGREKGFFQNKKWKNNLTWLTFGFLFFLAIILPWHLKMFVAFPQEFVNQYLLFNTKMRFGSSSYLKEIPLVSHPFSSLIIFLASSPVFFILPIILIKEIINLKKKYQPKSLFVFWILIFLLPVLLSSNVRIWYLVQLLPPFSILTAFFIIKLGKKLRPRQVSLKFLFFIIILITNLTLGPVLFFEKTDPSSEIIKAQKIANQVTGPDENIYCWENQYFLKTRFFQTKPVAVVDQNNLGSVLKGKKEIVVLVPHKELEELKEKAHLQEIVSFANLSLFKVSKLTKE